MTTQGVALPPEDAERKLSIDGIAGNYGSRYASPDEMGWHFEQSAFEEFCAALLARAAQAQAGGASPVAWRYRTNGVHVHFDESLPPEDAYDAGTLTPLFDTPVPSPSHAPIAWQYRALWTDGKWWHAGVAVRAIAEKYPAEYELRALYTHPPSPVLAQAREALTRLDVLLNEISYGRHHGWPAETLRRLENIATAAIAALEAAQKPRLSGAGVDVMEGGS